MKSRLWMIVLGSFALALLLGHGQIGLTDDDDFYVPAGESYVNWLGRALTFQDGAWSQTEIDKAFRINHEHPPVAKYVLGIFGKLFGALGLMDGSRIGTVFLACLIAGLLWYLARRHLGSAGSLVGASAVFFLLTMPRFYFHAHAGTLDVPVAAFYLLAATAALMGERSRPWALWAGPLFGLALATKLNAPFLLVPYGLFVLLTRMGAGPKAWRFPPNLPWAFVNMLLVGPLVMVLLWPWLWGDVVGRLTEYVQFHLNHYPIYFLYFGRLYEQNPFAPWHAPFVMAALTLPVVTLTLGGLGTVSAVRQALGRLRDRVGSDSAQRRAGDLWLFVLLNAAVSIGVVAFSGGPKYGGAKLFMPFFPFWALLAGEGLRIMWAALRMWLPRRGAQVAVLVVLLSAPAYALSYGAYGLSAYNGLIGGVSGATRRGFERQYYDVAYRDLIAWFNTNAPQDARIHFLPNNWEYVRTYKWFKRSGALRKDLSVVRNESAASLVVITHERRFKRYAEDLRRYRGRKVLVERSVDGTPLWTVYRR